MRAGAADGFVKYADSRRCKLCAWQGALELCPQQSEDGKPLDEEEVRAFIMAGFVGVARAITSTSKWPMGSSLLYHVKFN